MQKKYLVTAVLGLLLASPSLSWAEGKNGVAAVVNGQEIKVSEIREAYNSNPQLKKQVPFDEYYAKALDIVVSGKLVDQAAEKDKITQTNEYKKQLELAKKELAQKVYIEKQVKNNVKDSEVKKLYDDYKAKFVPEKEVNAKHILVDDETTAKEIIAKLNKGGNFDNLAKQYSKDKTVDLGYFSAKTMVPEFSDAAFKMKKGQVSKKPVKTQYGYHVIKVIDTRNSKPLEFKAAEPQIKAMLTQQAIAQTLEDLNQKAKVQKYDLKGNPID